MIRFSLRDKRLFEITEVEITRVDCIFVRFYILTTKHYHFRFQSPTMSQKRPADSVRELGPETTKAAIRDIIWRYIEDNDLADFPRPVTRRIPNVKVSNYST